MDSVYCIVFFTFAILASANWEEWDVPFKSNGIDFSYGSYLTVNEQKLGAYFI